MDTLNNHGLSQLYPNSISGVISRTLQLAPSTRFCDYPHFTVESTETWSGRATCQHCSSAAFPTLFPPTSPVCNAPAKRNLPLSLESRISCLWAFALIISIYLGSVSYHYLQYCCPLPESFSSSGITAVPWWEVNSLSLLDSVSLQSLPRSMSRTEQDPDPLPHQPCTLELIIQ